MAPTRQSTEDDNQEIRQRLALVESDLTDVKQIRSDITAIRAALIGDPKMGLKGAITRLGEHEKILLVITFILVAMGGERIIHAVLSVVH